MSTLADALINLFGAVMFCIAVSLCMYLSSQVLENSDLLVNGIQRDASLANETNLAQVQNMESDYSQIVAELMCDRLEYDILLNTYYIDKDDYNRSRLVEYISAISGGYEKHIFYDDQGNIRYIEYKSAGE